MSFSPVVAGIRKDPQLNQISLAYRNPDFIHERVFPQINNLKYDSGNIVKYGNENLRIHASTKRAVNDVSPHLIEFSVTNNDMYNIEYYDVQYLLKDQLKNQAMDPVNLERDALQFLEMSRDIAMEKALSDYLFAAGTYAAAQKATPTVKWGNSSSDPLTDMETACETIRQATGMRPNKAIIGAAVLNKLKTHPAIKERVNGVQKILSQADVIDIIKNHTGISELLVGNSIYVSSKEGQTETKADIWGNAMLFYKVPTAPSLMTSSFGYRFTLGANKQVTMWRDMNANIGENMKLEWAYQDLVLDLSSGFLLYTLL